MRVDITNWVPLKQGGQEWSMKRRQGCGKGPSTGYSRVNGQHGRSVPIARTVMAAHPFLPTADGGPGALTLQTMRTHCRPRRAAPLPPCPVPAGLPYVYLLLDLVDDARRLAKTVTIAGTAFESEVKQTWDLVWTGTPPPFVPPRARGGGGGGEAPCPHLWQGVTLSEGCTPRASWDSNDAWGPQSRHPSGPWIYIFAVTLPLPTHGGGTSP